MAASAAVREFLEQRHGVHLDDPEGLLEGRGAQTRYVIVHDVDEDLAEGLRDLVREAVAERLFRP